MEFVTEHREDLERSLEFLGRYVSIGDNAMRYGVS